MSGVLLHSQAHIVAVLLAETEIGSDPEALEDWPIHCDAEPDTPDAVITVYNTTGVTHGRTHWDGETQEHEGIQIRVRAATAPVGYAKINDIKVIIDEDIYLDHVTIDGTTYLVHALTRQGGILPLGKDSPSSHRSLFTLNAIVALRLA